jgi:cohesin domain-containing protein
VCTLIIVWRMFTMPRWVRLLFMFLFCLSIRYSHAQESPALLSLTAETTALQTGQEYEVTIRIDGAPDFWLADMEISYDPSLIYVMGTKAGSPVRAGALFEGTGALTVRNIVQGNRVLFTVSKAGEVPSAAGSGVIGVFRIYPLASGTTRLQFARGELRKLNAAQDGTDPVAFTPVLLDLSITGSPVEPPNEATATPAPTDTPTVQPQSNLPTQPAQATLVNVTVAPVTPQAAAQNTSPALLIALVVMVVGALGTGLTIFFWARSRR